MKKITSLGKGLGYRPDLNDFRDFIHKEYSQISYGLKSFFRMQDGVDLTNKMPPILDQDTTNSCVAHATSSAIQYQRMQENEPNYIPSRLFIYFNSRALENDTNEDNGTQIRDAIKSVISLGAPDENFWAFNPTQVTTKPNNQAYKNALTDIVTQYMRVPVNEAGITSALIQGYPVIFGTTLYTSFESSEVASSGIVPMPKASESIIGGHAMLIVGFIPSKRMFIVRNSWGTAWGQKGYCLFPYEYLTNTNLSDDFWIIQKTS